MENLRTLLTRPSKIARHKLALSILLLGLIGFTDASYLTVKHYTGGPVPCSIVEGCETVLSSNYAVFFGIPVALFGALYYAAITILSFAYVDSRRDYFFLVALKLTPVGLIASLYFLFLQIVVLKALCLYCLFSAFVSICLFLIALAVLGRELWIEAVMRLLKGKRGNRVADFP